MRLSLVLLFAIALTATPALAQRVNQLPPKGTMGGSLGSLPAPTAPALPAPFAKTEPKSTEGDLSDGIAAVVNEAVITVNDMRNRMKLVILSTGMPDSPEMRKKVAPQVFRSLVDEQLQIQEGKKIDIQVTKEEIEESMKRVARDNKIPGGDMVAFLKEQGVPASTLRTQIKATLTWNKYVMRVLRPRVDIGEDEINAVIQRMRANAGKQEYLVSEIFLEVESSDKEEEIKVLAENLTSQLKGGAVFGAVARQFSQSAGAAAGGDIGWIQGGQLASEVDKVMQTLQAGEIAGPIRSANGYHIIGVREKRTIALGDLKEMKVKLEQLFRPFAPDVEKESVLQEASVIRQTVNDCAGLKERIQNQFPSWRWQDLGEVKLDTAPAWLADKVATIAEGYASEPMDTQKGALMLYVCGRSMPENINRDSIRTAIGSERLELLAQRQIRDMRRSAYLDVRLKAAP